jgi:hypothetical protein
MEQKAKAKQRRNALPSGLPTTRAIKSGAPLFIAGYCERF